MSYCQGLSETLRNSKRLYCTCIVLQLLEIHLNNFYSHPVVAFSEFLRLKRLVFKSRFNKDQLSQPFREYKVYMYHARDTNHGQRCRIVESLRHFSEPRR